MKIGFFSSMFGLPWGGSESLWSRVAHQLLREGHRVTVNYKWWEDESHHITSLRDAGANVWLRENPTEPSPQRRYGLFRRPEHPDEFTARWLATERPDFVLVTLGYHLTRFAVATELIAQNIPYAINLQCASDRYSPDWQLEELRRGYGNAQAVYFVSRENWDRVETNLAMRLDRGSIVDNPFGVPFDAAPAWPSTEDGFRLACVGRIHFQSKGQDVLVNVLKAPKWKERDLQISVCGEDQSNQKQLEDLISLHHLENQLIIAGFQKDIESIWANHHGLILPSRYEGAALAVVEALICGRICITTDVGRNRELIQDGETGFIAPAATESLIDDALERAWQNRERWKDMGELNARRMRESYDNDPTNSFLQKLLSHVG